jgi:hypothetical protein
MTTHVTADQIQWWLDDSVVQDAASYSEEATEFNLQVTLSRLPIHLIVEEKGGPVRVVGQNEFDTPRARRLLADDDARRRLLDQIGPTLVSTPGFYTFLDEEGAACKLRDAETLQIEHRLYPDEVTQQALMDSLMAIATGMRYVQNVVGAVQSETSGEDESRDGDGE